MERSSKTITFALIGSAFLLGGCHRQEDENRNQQAAGGYGRVIVGPRLGGGMGGTGSVSSSPSARGGFGSTGSFGAGSAVGS
jgi:hypothetical protein